MESDHEHGLRTAFGLYERELIQHLKRLVHRGDCCYDVGASTGYYTLVCEKLSGGPVHAFEADPSRLRGLADALTRNGVRATITCAVVGVSGRQLALDEYIADGRKPPDFIKMDIEGGEYEALLGLRRTLKTQHPRLVIETHGIDVERRCITLLRGLGYQVTVIPMSRWFQETRPEGHNRWIAAE